jgi:acyl transferase domain-containing protein
LDSNDPSPLRIGSVKPNIGHLESASGVASLIKAILMLENDAMPPVINLQELKDSCTGPGVLVSLTPLLERVKAKKLS